MTEMWLTGPVDGVHPLLMPAAHALLQTRDDVSRLLDGLTVEQIWQRPGNSASIGFHAIHIGGATERLLTYARGEQLSEGQVAHARAEAQVDGLSASEIITRVHAALDAGLELIRRTDASGLTSPREVGRKKLPSTVLGIIFHAAEHAARHAGQMATLRKILS